MQNARNKSTALVSLSFLYMYKAVRVCMLVCLCPSSALSSSHIWLIFGMRDLWVNRKVIGYAKLHFEAALRPNSRSNAASTT